MEERTGSLRNAPAPCRTGINFLNIGQDVFSTNIFPFIFLFSCLILRGMVLQEVRRLKIERKYEKIVYQNLRVDRNRLIFSSMFQRFATS